MRVLSAQTDRTIEELLTPLIVDLLREHDA
jgi:hypothetical protein